MATRGVTPFDITALVREYGAKVVKKSTNMIQGGAGGFQYVVKDFRKQAYNSDVFAATPNYPIIQGWTKTVLLVAYQLVSDGGGSTMRAYCTKHYRCQPITNQYAAKDFSGIN